MQSLPSNDFPLRVVKRCALLFVLASFVSCTPPKPEESTWPDSLTLIERSKWAQETIGNPETIVPMDTITRITIHHDGMPVGPMESDEQIRYRIVSIRNSHMKKYADIGYHFVIDGKGRVWEGRPLDFQGAHVKGQNEGNVGVLFLGNSQIDKPTEVGLEGLYSLIHYLMKRHKVQPGQIFTHGELAQTGCPGKLLQARIDEARKNGTFDLKDGVRKIRTGIDWARPWASAKEQIRRWRDKIGF